MISVNENSKKVCSDLLVKLNGKQHLRIEIPEYMPLVIELIGEQVSTPFGIGKLYSLAHYYEQNGDLMRDPEMCFIVVDNRPFPDTWELLEIYPQMYRLDSLGIYQECVRIEDGTAKSFHRKMQSDLIEFADIWFENIKQQGFLK